MGGRYKIVRRNCAVVMALTAQVLIAPACGPSNVTSYAQEPPRIFRCEANGKITYSDQRCASTPTTEVVLRPTNSYHADTSPTTPSRSASVRREQSPKQAASIADEQQRVKQQCQRLADQLTTIEIKMRSGYSAKQGEQLRERQRQLEQRRRTERCR